MLFLYKSSPIRPNRLNMKRLLANSVYALLYVLSLLPLSIHYVLSDMIYLLLYRLIGYRKKVVRQNLRKSFPQKTEQELRQIERRFFHWLCDYFVETVKLITISEEEIKRRMVFKNLEQLNETVAKGQSVAVYLGHYCNWEWVTSMPFWVNDKAQCGQIYHPLENAESDRIFLKLRQRLGAVCIPMAETIRHIVKYNQQGIPVVIGYISDQVPFWNNIHHWCQFLEQDTPVLTGTERLARKLNHAVFYLDMKRPRRGYYEGEIKLICQNPKETKDYQITDAYFQMLEQTIRRSPENWLWTHNRWKRTHEEFNLRYDETTGKVDITSSVEQLKQKKGIIK